MRRRSDRRGTRSGAYRSRFEATVASALERAGITVEYEPKASRLRYTTAHEYTPDFRLPNGVLIEVKGYFPAPDRAKLLAVWKANPVADIRLVFQRPSVPIYKGSKTTYAAWADKHGFPWATGGVPPEWAAE